MKIMFVAKRARQDVLPGVAFLATRTRDPTEQDWNKLVRLISWMNKTYEDVSTLEADDKNEEYWHVDAAFAVHEDMRSHTGATFSLGKGVLTSVSTKQKVNSNRRCGWSRRLYGRTNLLRHKVLRVKRL